MESARMFQLSVIMTILCLFLNIATAVDKNDTVSSSQPLTRNQTIVSAGQLFELGFFSPGNSNKWFIGIWYKELQMNTKTVVWVANRDNPLATSSGTLKIYKNRKLILTNERGKTIWHTNQTTKSSNTVAQLLDTGNFVVRRKEDSDPKNYLWQSFDYPTDTWLPGMKLGKTDLDRFLTSWKNDDDPSSGDFSFKLNISGFPEFILWKKDQTIVYRSGPWNGLKLSGVQGLGTTEGLVNLSFVMDKHENTYSFQMTDSSKYTRLSLNSYGVLQSFLWIPMSKRWNVLWYAPYDHCDMYRVCGAFGICDTTQTKYLCRCIKGFEPKHQQEWNLRDGSGGCASTSTNKLNCSNDVFISVNNVKLPESSTAVLNGNMSPEDCENKCQKDCSCTAYAHVMSGFVCVTWKDALTDLRKYRMLQGGNSLFVRVSKLVLDEKPKSKPSSGAWDVRTVIVVSMALQAVLVFLSPFRKKVSSPLLSIPLWLAYLLADLAATYGLGLIAKSQSSNRKSCTAVDTETRSVHALWAPFLLFHLGGPDTITAFSPEDNELWLRHSLGLFVQGWLVVYIFAHTFFMQKMSDNKLWVPTMLINIASLIKYVEKTRALYLASTERFRGSLVTDPDPDEHSSKKLAKLPREIEITPEVKKMTDWEIVLAAHQNFDTSKGLIADWILSLHERTKSRSFFFQRTPRDAFKVVEVELNFIYDILYTKIVVVHGTLGYILRFVTICLTCASLVLFYKRGSYKIERVDTTITRALHICAMALDAAGFIMALTSDWTAVMLTKKDNILFKCLRAILCVRRDRWSDKNQPHDKKQPDRKQGPVKIFLSMIMEFVAKAIGYDILREIIRRRWSGLISEYNLIHYCLNPRPKRLDKVIKWVGLGLTKKADSYRYVKSKKIDCEIRDLIFDELKKKSEKAVDWKTSKEIHSARGDWTLQATGHSSLLPWINDADYDESILMWHIATDLCYSEAEVKNKPKDVRTYRRLAKILSDHMLYLVMMESNMMSPVAGIVEKRFKDTCDVAKKFFEDEGIYKQQKENNEDNNKKGRVIKKENKKMNKEEGDNEKEEINLEEPDEKHIKACLKLLGAQTEVIKPAEGDRSKSVLFDACRLAKDLNMLGEGEKWEIMSKVWVELLCYAASRCRPTTYTAQLSKGGQFITFVWLLMAHFGIGNLFQISEDRERAVLVVGK